MEKKQKIEISTMSFVKFFGVIIGLLFLWWIREVVLLLFVVMIIVAALDPIVSWAEKRNIPRGVGVSFLYLLIICIIGLIISLLLPPVITQIATLANNLPAYVSKVSVFYSHYSESISSWQEILNTASKQISNLSSGFYNATISFFGGIASFVTVIVLSFYILLERDNFSKYILSLAPLEKKQALIESIQEIALKMGSWFRGQIIISSLIGALVAITLAIAGAPYALMIGLIAALVEIVPIIGPFISGSLAVLTTLLVGGWVKALIVLAIFLAIQQLENHIVVPKIMGKAVNLSPAVIIIALLVGGTIAGIPGAILAIPAAAGLSVITQKWSKLKK